MDRELLEKVMNKVSDELGMKQCSDGKCQNIGVTEFVGTAITPNRPDCLSIIGMSREIAATFGKKINPPVNQLAFRNKIHYQRLFSGNILRRLDI